LALAGAAVGGANSVMAKLVIGVREARGTSLDSTPLVGVFASPGTMGLSDGAQSAGNDTDNCDGKARSEGADATSGTGAVDESAGTKKLSLSNGRDARFGEE